VDELPFAADRCPCVEKLRTYYQLLLASETVRCSPSWGCAPPLNHVPEGMRLFVLASLELPMCILVCQPR
jgi:hypothetical protein